MFFVILSHTQSGILWKTDIIVLSRERTWNEILVPKPIQKFPMHKTK